MLVHKNRNYLYQLYFFFPYQHPLDNKWPGLVTPLPCHQFCHLQWLQTPEIHAACSNHSLNYLAAHPRYSLCQMYNMH